MHIMSVLIFILGILFSAAPLQTVAAEQSDAEESPVRCISLSRIKNTSILDKQNIVFYMNGGKQYLNTLPYACHGLSKNKPFMYRTSLNQLCDLDIITVLDDFGDGLMPRASCGLGTFTPITEDDIKMLKKRPNKIKPLQ